VYLLQIPRLLGGSKPLTDYTRFQAKLQVDRQSRWVETAQESAEITNSAGVSARKYLRKLNTVAKKKWSILAKEYNRGNNLFQEA
jgi:hypothetical protein